MIKKRRVRKSGRALTFKSGLESKVASILPEKVGQAYEVHKIKYLVEHEYTPDFSINDTTFIEAKGYFRASDRSKHLAIKKLHPELTIYFVFGDAQNKLNKASKTTYADWATKYGFDYVDLKRDKKLKKEWFV
jgi:hypothetical protein